MNPIIKGYFDSKKAHVFRDQEAMDEILEIYGEQYLLDMIKRISKKKHDRKTNKKVA